MFLAWGAFAKQECLKVKHEITVACLDNELVGVEPPRHGLLQGQHHLPLAEEEAGELRPHCFLDKGTSVSDGSGLGHSLRLCVFIKFPVHAPGQGLHLENPCFHSYHICLQNWSITVLPDGWHPCP